MPWLGGTVSRSDSDVLAELPDHLTWEGLHLEVQRRHVILHEYGHILLMHGGCELTLGNAFAHIGGSRRIKTLLGRSSTWTTQEIAAENAATRLAARLTQQVNPLLEAF